MGALNGSANCVATGFTNDLYRPFASNLSEKTYLRTTRANGPGVVAGLILRSVFQFWISQYTSLNLSMYAFTGLVSSLLFGYLFSLVLGSPKKSLEGLTILEV